MAFPVTIHYDNGPGFADPHVWVWYDASVSTQDDVAAAGVDAFGPFFRVQAKRKDFGFKFKQGPGTSGPWEGSRLDRYYEALAVSEAGIVEPAEVWTVGSKAFVYPVQPRAPETESCGAVHRAAAEETRHLLFRTPGRFPVWARPRWPTAASCSVCISPTPRACFVMGSFNDWQRPGRGHRGPLEVSGMQTVPRILRDSEHVAAGYRQSARGR